MTYSLGTTPVGEVATFEVISVNPNLKMEHLAQLFEKRDINAAPVVDKEGKCIGMITSGDLVRYESLRRSIHHQASHGVTFDLAHYSDNPIEKLLGNRFDDVEYHMTQAVQAIESHVPLSRAARIMCKEHIHHLVLLDNEQRPCGIISSLDILGIAVGEPVNSRSSDNN